jgi:hypothetical protein
MRRIKAGLSHDAVDEEAHAVFQGFRFYGGFSPQAIFFNERTSPIDRFAAAGNRYIGHVIAALRVTAKRELSSRKKTISTPQGYSKP